MRIKSKSTMKSRLMVQTAIAGSVAAAVLLLGPVSQAQAQTDGTNPNLCNYYQAGYPNKGKPCDSSDNELDAAGGDGVCSGIGTCYVDLCPSQGACTSCTLANGTTGQCDSSTPSTCVAGGNPACGETNPGCTNNGQPVGNGQGCTTTGPTCNPTTGICSGYAGQQGMCVQNTCIPNPPPPPPKNGCYADNQQVTYDAACNYQCSNGNCTLVTQPATCSLSNECTTNPTAPPPPPKNGCYADNQQVTYNAACNYQCSNGNCTLITQPATCSMSNECTTNPPPPPPPPECTTDVTPCTIINGMGTPENGLCENGTNGLTCMPGCSVTRLGKPCPIGIGGGTGTYGQIGVCATNPGVPHEKWARG